VYERVNTTREELRYVATYQAGQTLEVGRGGGRTSAWPLAAMTSPGSTRTARST
jgi:hypothetical protein